MIRLVALHGTGDTYLVCALIHAFEKHHGIPAKVICKNAHRYIPEMFGFLDYEIADVLVAEAETSATKQRFYLNEIRDGSTYFVHPSFARSDVRVDQFTFVCRPISQADMYKALLHLPLDTPPDRPKFELAEQPPGRRVLLIKEARSWPNTQPAFWDKLQGALADHEYKVLYNPPVWNLEALFSACAISDWVIGPQCGVMSILCHAKFPCRKSFCTPQQVPGIPIKTTMPYAGVRTFAGEDYDVDEHVVADDNHSAIIHRLLAGAVKRNQQPVFTVDVPLSLGDFLDRLAVLLAKYSKFDTAGRVKLQRELDRLCAIYSSISSPLMGDLNTLVDIHQKMFDAAAEYVPDAFAGKNNEEMHRLAISLNRQRVEIRQGIDAKMGAAYSEIKDYYK